MTEKFRLAGYCRISVDEEADRDNTSIENQKAIINEYVKRKFPNSAITFFEDRDRSGYTFEQRESYQKMRHELTSRRLDILIVKDFSRFSRRNSRGLVELEDLRDAGVRIISIDDGIDFPNDDDWLKIQFQFLINEMPVTDTSRKVKSVVKRRQEDGKWICAAPYGYIINKAQAFEIVPTEADVVRKIYSLYNEGWGYKKIANYLTDEGIPTPRMAERDRKEAEGAEYKRAVKSAWSIVTVQGILDNDFYIGTLRQGKYARKKINGDNIKRDESEHYVFEKHHQEIISYRTFALTKALREKRSTSSYRGIKINDNVYSGFLVCGDCCSPMFAMSRSDLKDAYRCGEYHKRGLKGCTSHHIRVERLDSLVKAYVLKIKENSSDMLARLNEDLEKEKEDIYETEQAAENLNEVLLNLQEELKATKRQRIRDILKNPQKEEILDETYEELENDLIRRIEGITNQIDMTNDKRNTIIEVNRAAKTAMDVFDDILNKDKLERTDLELVIEKIKVYENRIEIELKSDIDALLRCGKQTEDQAVKLEMGHNTSAWKNGCVSAYVNVIKEGDPLEIYTDTDGSIIFKKYSQMDNDSEMLKCMCEAIYKTICIPCAICDRSHILASVGVKSVITGKQISQKVEDAMNTRSISVPTSEIEIIEGEEHILSAIAPIISQGDITGAIMLLNSDGVQPDTKPLHMVQTFLSKYFE